jgi:hypothetical protein
LRLLIGGTFEVHGGGTVRAHPMLAAKRAQRGLADRQALLLIERRREFAIGPVGTVEPTAAGTFLDPIEDLRGQVGRNRGGASGRPTNGEPLQPSCLIRVEPTLDGAWADGSIFGDVAMASPSGGHQEGLTAMVQTRIGSGLEGGFELMRLQIAQGQFHHDVVLPGVRPGRVPALIGQSYSRFV